MEGLSEISYPKKRILNIFPILLTITISQTAKAENKPLPTNPILQTKDAATVLSIPIFANTFTTFSSLKAAKASTLAVSETVTNEKPSQNAFNVQPEQVVKEVALGTKQEDGFALLSAPKSVNLLEVKPELLAVEATKSEKKTFIFNELTELEKREIVVGFARSHVDWGFQYRYGGTDLEDGLDCSAFMRYVHSYFSIETPRSSREQFAAGDKISVQSAKTGDLVFFGAGKVITHVGMVVSNDEKGLVIVHCCNRGIIQENVTESSYWKPKLKDYAVSFIK
ncbi:MAG: C40 family peptidase [Saprospiraceae bacterium]|nr:C40 family peptidase [Saprospiraceae bacterium]